MRRRARVSLQAVSRRVRKCSFRTSLRRNSKEPSYDLLCNSPCTILEALKKNNVLIVREKKPRAAVCSHFPCDLLENNEKLTIQFIPGKPCSTVSQKAEKPEDLVTFFIQTQGGQNISKTVMRNNNIQKNVHHVCLYAFKGETVEQTLNRDGRFSDFLIKSCDLRNVTTDVHVDMDRLVDDLDQQRFQVMQLSGPKNLKSPTANLKVSPVKNEEPEDVTSNETQPQAEKASTSQTTPEEEHTPQTRSRSQDVKSALETARKKAEISVSETEENSLNISKFLETILDNVRLQFKQVSEKLKKQNNIWETFRVEYDKSAQSCCEVGTVKTLMNLADSVCRIRINTGAVGTGFVLCHIPSSTPQQSFILTNAHVIMPVVEDYQRMKLYDNITVTAEFEDWKGNEMKLYSRHAKKELIACQYNPAEHLDFALLELEPSDDEWSLPDGLLSKYLPSSGSGGICIIGHPDGHEKKMDPTFIVEPENHFNSVMTHIIKNADLKPLMQKKCVKENWIFDSSRITYNSCFFHGSSGSPVFDSRCSLIGIHSGGYCYTETGKEKKSIIEYAYPLENTWKCIIKQTSENRKDVSRYIQSQCNIRTAIKQENTNSGLDTDCIEPSDQPMDTS
uniref:Serine protease n=1 Tax=Astyanax mexicanus TaxID=7994 RepID=A0A3B1KD48_ASTMX